MTFQRATKCLLAKIGPHWPRCKPVPTELTVALCEAVWREGGSPTVGRLASHLSLSVRAVRPGVIAWRRRVNTSLSHQYADTSVSGAESGLLDQFGLARGRDGSPHSSGSPSSQTVACSEWKDFGLSGADPGSLTTRHPESRGADRREW